MGGAVWIKTLNEKEKNLEEENFKGEFKIEGENGKSAWFMYKLWYRVDVSVLFFISRGRY